jgi:3-oxoacyl-[acyl-carrier protein] reductase
MQETALASGSPLKRCGVPEDIGKVVSFLASPDAEWVNGEFFLFLFLPSARCKGHGGDWNADPFASERIGQIIPVNGGANI